MTQIFTEEYGGKILFKSDEVMAKLVESGKENWIWFDYDTQRWEPAADFVLPFKKTIKTATKKVEEVKEKPKKKKKKIFKKDKK